MEGICGCECEVGIFIVNTWRQNINEIFIVILELWVKCEFDFAFEWKCSITTILKMKPNFVKKEHAC